MVLPALTSDELIALSGPSTRRTYLSVIPDDDALVTTLTVNQSAIPFPITQLTVTGTITDIAAGMEAVVIRSGVEIGRYRVRLDAETATLYLMETDRADSGALTYLLRPTGISNGDTIQIYDRINLYSALPRIVLTNPETSGAIYEDFDRVPGIESNFPSPIANMRVNTSRGGHFATRVQDDGTVAITAVVTALLWPPTTSVTYAWSAPAEWTGVSGGSTATLTGTAPIGNWKLECTITPNAGPAIKIVRRVHIHGITQNPPILIADGSFNGSRDRTGRRMSFTLIDNAIASVPHTSMLMVFNDCTWNGSSTSVPTATRIFVGWMNRIGFTAEQQSRHAMPEIVGPAGILDLLGNTSQLFEVKNVATTWQEMAYPLATFSYVIWWLMKHRAANLLNLFNHWPLSTSSTVGRQPKFNVPTGSLLSQLKGMARRYREANFGFNSGGEAFVRVHPSMTPVGERSAIPTRDTLTPSIYTLPVEWEHSLRPTTRQVQAAAGTWDGAAALPTPMRSDAPETPGQGTGDDTWQEQIIEDQVTFNVLSGLRLAMLNAPTSQIPFTIPHNRDVLEPAEMERVSAVIAADQHPMDVEWEFFAVPSVVSERNLADGATEIVATVEPETSGDKGVTRAIPPPGSNVNPDLPPVDEIPFQPTPILDWGDDDVPFDPETPMPLNPQPGAPAEYGRMLSATSEGRVQRLTWPAGTFTLADFSPSANFRALLGGSAFTLHRDEGNPKQVFLAGKKAILRCADWKTATPKWSAPVSLGVGITDIDNGDGTHTLTLDFTQSQCGIDVDKSDLAWNASGLTSGFDYVAGQGWRTPNHETPTNIGLGYVRHAMALGRAVSSAMVVRSFTYTFTATPSPSRTVRMGPLLNDYLFPMPGNSYFADVSNALTTATVTYNPTDYLHVAIGDVLGFGVQDYEPGDGCTTCGTIINSVEITYEDGDLPFAFSNDEIVADFKSSPCQDRRDSHYWFVKRAEDGTDYLWLKRTFDNFRSIVETRIARYSADIAPSIAIDPHNWKFVYVTAGDPAEDDCYLYESTDGGGTFAATAVAILASGGQIGWNWSTQTPNAPNTSKDNLIIVRGLDGSNNLLARRGLSGSDVTIATGSGKYGFSPQALWLLARDLDFVRLALQDNSLRLSSNAAGSFSGGTAIPGGTSHVARGLDGWPTDDAFNVIWGYRTLCFTTDSGSSYTDLWSDFDTFRSATYTSGNETLIGVVIDISSRYTTPVLGVQ